MYIFSYNRFSWFDRVFKLKIVGDDIWLSKILKRWSLFSYQDDRFLCLWNEISFQEQYQYIYEIDTAGINLICEHFLTLKTLDLVNWMVYRWYSNYKSVLKYFVSFDIDGLTNKWKIQEKKIKIKNNEILIQNGNISIAENKLDWQQLVIFPDLWTLFNTIDESVLSAKWNVFLKSNDTQNQKDKKWRMIKNWEISNVFCTHSEIFQDRNNLRRIILIDPYKRYYENQQDPRYSVVAVVKQMWEIYWANVDIG